MDGSDAQTDHSPPTPSTSAASTDDTTSTQHVSDQAPNRNSPDRLVTDPESSHDEAHSDTETTPDVTGVENAEVDAGENEWITPKNVNLHKSRDLGLFPALSLGVSCSDTAAGKAKRKIPLKVACLTGDFAMQNVALQMGLNIFGVGGNKVKEVKTWVLRCHACFKYVHRDAKYVSFNLTTPTLQDLQRPNSEILSFVRKSQPASYLCHVHDADGR